MDSNKLRQAVLERVAGQPGKPTLSCHQAHELAAELGVDLAQIGQICQTAGIKITNCQLGCFGDGKKHE